MRLETEKFVVKTTVHGGTIELSLDLSAAQGADLANRLAATMSAQSELCLRLAGGWVLYLKQAIAPKALVAHPDSESWVGTLALSSAQWEEFCKALTEGQGFSTPRWIGPSRFHNLIVTFDFS